MFVELLCICNQRDHAYFGAGFRFSVGKFQAMAGLGCVDGTGRSGRSRLPAIVGIDSTGG